MTFGTRITHAFPRPGRMLLVLGQGDGNLCETFCRHFRHRDPDNRPPLRSPITLISRTPRPGIGGSVRIWIDHSAAPLSICRLLWSRQSVHDEKFSTTPPSDNATRS